MTIERKKVSTCSQPDLNVVVADGVTLGDQVIDLMSFCRKKGKG